MNRPQTKQERRANNFMGYIVFGIVNVLMLYMGAKYWAYTLVFMSAVLGLCCLPVLGARAGLAAVARENKLMLHGLLLSGLLGAAILSGFSIFLSIGLLVASFMYLRSFPVFAEMREYMPELSTTLEMIPLVIAAIAASWITLDNGQQLSMFESAQWFFGLAVLFTIAFGLAWVYWMLMSAHSANIKVTARIKQTLHQNNIKETAANIAEVRKVNDGAAIAQTELEEAERNNTNVELMHALLGKGAFVNQVGGFGIVPMFLLSGPIVLNFSVYPAWVYVAVKTHRPATMNDFVRGIRVV